MNKSKIAGWVLSALLAALLVIASAGSKFSEWEGKEEQFGSLGFDNDLMVKIGIAEVSITGLFLIPQTAFVGAIALTGYLGGATCAHIRVGDPFFMPVIIGVLVWVALGLRDPRIFALAFGLKRAETPRDARTSDLQGKVPEVESDLPGQTGD